MENNDTLDNNENKNIYAVDENFNKTEVYSKEDVDNKILSGTSEPETDLGKNGDIYLQYSE